MEITVLQEKIIVDLIYYNLSEKEVAQKHNIKESTLRELKSTAIWEEIESRKIKKPNEFYS